jgi:hypothetical protein
VTIHLRTPDAFLFVILFLMQFYGLWFSLHHDVYLQDFVQHTTSAATLLALAYFSAASAFLTTAIIAKLLEAFRP